MSDSGSFKQLEEAKVYTNNHRKNYSISENRKSVRYNHQVSNPSEQYVSQDINLDTIEEEALNSEIRS